MKKTFKILSIDGGGIKGIYSIALLSKLEELTDQKIVNSFDLICGTSTGGLIALLLGAGYSPREILEFYKTNANIIFPQSKKANLLKLAMGKAKFSNEPLKKVLKQYLGDKKMQDSIVKLCIPAVDSDNERPTVFKTGHSKEYVRDPHLLMLDVALATSAAPTYFPNYKIESLGRSFVDGGLSANNPSLIGVIEAMNLFVGQNKEFENFSVFSIGNIDINTGCFDKLQHGILLKFKFAQNLISLLMRIQNKTTKNMVGLLAKATNSEYFRIENNDLASNQHEKIKLDSSLEDVLNLLIAKGQSDAEYSLKEIQARKILVKEADKEEVL
ncbi:patatin-like phospholipase family protein [bacterium]|nr:patatin-like phospholipase family protein [bacterium]